MEHATESIFMLVGQVRAPRLRMHPGRLRRSRPCTYCVGEERRLSATSGSFVFVLPRGPRPHNTFLVPQGSPPTAHSWSVRLLFACWAGERRQALLAAGTGVCCTACAWTARSRLPSRQTPSAASAPSCVCAPRPRTRPVFSVIMLAAYTANLTANLTVSQLATTIQNLADLKSAGGLFGVPADSSVARYFKESRVRGKGRGQGRFRARPRPSRLPRSEPSFFARPFFARPFFARPFFALPFFARPFGPGG